MLNAPSPAMELVQHLNVERRSRTIRLDVHVLPWEDKVQGQPRETIMPWTEPCSADVNVEELEAMMRSSFSTLHRGKG